MWNTFNGFRVTKREGEWIDDILSSSAITPLDAAVSLTDPSVYPVAASDHNGVFARMRFGAAV
jgi:hypothetical protein